MTSWLRPSKRSPSVCVPCSPWKVYGFSTSSQGRLRRSRLSWSRSRVNSFSFARCFFRALSHSSCFTTLWVAMSSLLLTLSRSLEVGPQESKPRQDRYTPASHLFTALPRLASRTQIWPERFDHRRSVARPWRRIAYYIGANDYRSSHRRDRGVGRGTCESHHDLGASRWPRIDRQRTCLCRSGHASDRQHASRQAYRGRLAVADQRGAASVFPACITEGRRDARWHHGCRSRKQDAIPSPLPSSPRA